MSHLDEVAMGSEERQELEAKIDELEDRVSESYTTLCVCIASSWQVKQAYLASKCKIYILFIGHCTYPNVIHEKLNVILRNKLNSRLVLLLVLFTKL